MAQRTRVRRKVRRNRPKVRRASSAGATAMRAEAKQGMTAGGGLMIGGVQDPAEKEADRTADRVMRLQAPVVHRKCAECEAEDKEEKRAPAPPREDDKEVKPKAAAKATPAAPGVAAAPASASATNVIRSLDGGRPLASAERAFFEPRFGADFSSVRVHEDRQADVASKAINARAFALGSDIAFARDEYAPGTESSRRLMAHELAHVVEGEDSGVRTSVRRKRSKPTEPDPLCADYDSAIDVIIAKGRTESFKTSGDDEDRLRLIQSLKWIKRCGTDKEKEGIVQHMTAELGEVQALSIWKETGTAFGGYRGVFPGYYKGAKSRLEKLGVSKAEGFEKFDYPEPTIVDTIFDPRAEKSASAMAATIERTDILYFYGHQYAQYGNPGAFANGTQDEFVDLRKLEGKGKFGSVKLIVSTSCAIICKEALEVFAKLFPNAVILGYRKSAPLKGGAVRNSFDSAIKSLKKPLLLDQPVDVTAITDVWKSVVRKHHPNEATRLPGYYQDGTVHYLAKGKWHSIAGTDEANSCKKKGTQIQQAR